jgi:signal transduction histidine kinase
VPAPTIRLRLTALYGLVFLVTGAILLTIGYLLVRHNLESRPDIGAVTRRLGLPGSQIPVQIYFSGRPTGFPGATPFAHVADVFRQQFVSDSLSRLVLEYVLALIVMSAISVAAGWALAGRALAPLRAITSTARRVSGENLGERIALAGPADELKELADTFDRMLERLDAAFASQRRFVANASHELRTPLAIMRTEIDVTLGDREAPTEELRLTCERVRDTIDRSEGLIEALLMLARSGVVRGHGESVDLAALAADCITDLRSQADVAGVTVSADLRSAPVRGEPRLLARMIANLIDNGLRHNEPGGYVEVKTEAAAGAASLTVRNGGAVIVAEDARTLTEPFRRLQRSGSGYGLGLSIVDSVARAHGGEALVRAPADGGLSVQVVLPADPGTDQGEVLPKKATALTRI